ncbi:isocyanide synthase family protein [Aspergillus undulatus]|uniref:isocyanide synthase family protein n=1 Tax=Aspergillus undulatus TaxID=1810928 RepID=UPI003CCE3304
MSINFGSSIYHHVLGIYQRDGAGNLVVAEGKHAEQLRSRWSDIFQSISTQTSKQNILSSGKIISTTETTLSFALQMSQPESYHILQIHELHEPGSQTVRGLLTSSPSPELENDFFNWATTYLLLNARLLTTSPSSESTDHEAMKLSERIANLFEESLKNTSTDDKWITGGGRQYFINKVYSFVKDGKRIELCLPAFPCKSSSPNKVAGASPDAAEYLALGHLHSFVEQVSRIYRPGATLWIISDGHVFSDNIGVDDILVDTYGQTLATQYHLRMANRTSGKDFIMFTGLQDLFFSSPEATSTFSETMLADVTIPQPIETARTDSAQKCRLLLEKVGGIDRAHLRQLITEKHADTLALYQGQSRFMLEDLASYLEARNIGSKAKKRIASQVAAEMIARNHAYSNLVELLFPHHIRLSIHAHNNAGPKFGIRLFPKGTVRPVQDNQSLLSITEAPKPVYEFQIPTPWHNSLIEVEGHDMALLTRSGAAREAVASGLFAGGWVDGPQGGYFAISRVKVHDEETENEVALSGSETETEAEVQSVAVAKEPLKVASIKKKSPLRAIGSYILDKIRGVWSAVRGAMSKA